MKRYAGIVAGYVGCLALAGGCVAQREAELAGEVQTLRARLAVQESTLAQRSAANDELQRQLAAARAISADDLKLLATPVSIEIDRITGGYDEDGSPGDDGVRVYLRPRDAAGDVLKAVGDIRVQLFDLAAAPADSLVGEVAIPAAAARDIWYGKLLSSHFAVPCPFRTPPRNPEITIRVTFADYLTKRVLTAQANCTVRVPAN